MPEAPTRDPSPPVSPLPPHEPLPDWPERGPRFPDPDHLVEHIEPPDPWPVSPSEPPENNSRWSPQL